MYTKNIPSKLMYGSVKKEHISKRDYRLRSDIVEIQKYLKETIILKNKYYFK
jgi:hypothetical protein